MTLHRREFLWKNGGGFGALALLDLIRRESGASLATSAQKPHFPGHAKRVVYFFMNGGPSHVDTFDPKPALVKHHDQPYHGKLDVGSNERPVGHLAKSAFQFSRHGESGLEISELYPHLSRHADSLCVIRSMHCDAPGHGPGLLQMNSGSILLGHPSLGSWLSYGLGSMNENLPTFVVMSDPRGGTRAGTACWSAGYMPAIYQGTLFRGSGPPLLNLDNPPGISTGRQFQGINLLSKLNREHLGSRQEDSELVARIKSYELAYRMQTSAVTAVDIEDESEKTKEMYGVNHAKTEIYGRQCLLARRLLERGVRFVQLYSGGAGNATSWDAHTNCIQNHKLHAGETDQPMAALMTDLKNRGLWDDTLLIWGGEFGRTPTSEGKGKPGRDHNPYGFSTWLAGGGVKGGQAVGATDELGFEAVEEHCHVSDFHATILHLMGLDHHQLTFAHQGLDKRLTGVEERRILRQVLA